MIHKISHSAYHRALGMLLVRVAGGYVFVMHGWSKLNNLSGTSSFFSTLGLPAGTATFIALLEFVGGLMLILGIVPRLAGLLLGIEMVVAMLLVSIPKGNFEFELLLAAVSFGVFLFGSGKYSLYSMERE